MGSNITQSEKRIHTPEFEQNITNYHQLLETFEKRLSQVTSHGPEAAKEKHRSRGKLLARERINLLVDQNTPFWNSPALPLMTSMIMHFPRQAL